jgi:hypothetical protein
LTGASAADSASLESAEFTVVVQPRRVTGVVGAGAAAVEEVDEVLGEGAALDEDEVDEVMGEGEAAALLEDDGEGAAAARDDDDDDDDRGLLEAADAAAPTLVDDGVGLGMASEPLARSRHLTVRRLTTPTGPAASRSSSSATRRSKAEIWRSTVSASTSSPASGGLYDDPATAATGEERSSIDRRWTASLAATAWCWCRRDQCAPRLACCGEARAAWDEAARRSEARRAKRMIERGGERGLLLEEEGGRRREGGRGSQSALGEKAEEGGWGKEGGPE